MISGSRPDGSRPDGALVARLRAAGCVFAEDEAALLVEAAGSAGELERLVAARAAGVPLEQLLGWTDFCGLRIAVDTGVFVPRQRTALLVAEAARLVRAGDVVLDLCCGSGAIGAALLAAVPGLVLHAADSEEAAVRCARRNLPGAYVHRGDLFAALPRELAGCLALVACNAPYVPTDAIALMPPEAREHEPRVTLDGGADGLAVLRRVVAEAPTWLRPGGSLLFEVGERQVPAAEAMLVTAGLEPRLCRDEEVGATVVAGRRP
jgi:release factor glutamine methyltransferase